MIIFSRLFGKLDGISNNSICTAFDLNKAFHKSINSAALDHSLSKIEYLSYRKSPKAYDSSDQVATSGSEVVMLSGNALLNGIARYPYRAKYVFYHLDFLDYRCYLGLFGLFRRFLIGWKSNNSKLRIVRIDYLLQPLPQLYVVIKNNNAVINTQFSISRDIGYKGLLDSLNSINCKYCVLRFFENLPNENRIGGDIDILIEDDAFEVAAKFCEKNPGKKMVDMYSVTGPASSARIPYYTPYLSQKILSEAVDYNGYKVPSKENYLHSFIYHCLYHKGLSSGIQTKYSSLKPSKNPDNDYLKKILEIAETLSINPGNTMEELDDYMYSVGWKPHIDTLQLLSTSNKWINKHLRFAKKSSELTLSVCILKNGFRQHSNISTFAKELKSKGLSILHQEVLVGKRKSIAYSHLRGGNWSSTNESKYIPDTILVLKGSSYQAFICRVNNIAFNPRPIKVALRKKFDHFPQSIIHMTDDTDQALEYIDLMYPEWKHSLISDIQKKDAERLKRSKFVQLISYIFKAKSFLSSPFDKISNHVRSII